MLDDYVRTESDSAFRELVSRYVDLVYSTALRLVESDTHRAEDVAQTVFVDLARSARTLSNDVMLGGWLHRHTCFVAMKTMRGERRRQSRERQAVEMNALQSESGPDFSLVAPQLDEAINELGESDRAAILLRFFEQHDFRSVGQALGSSEDAARMRVTRALEKLESLLKSRGVTTSATALAAALSANAIQAAPIGLAVSISTATVLVGTTLQTSTAFVAAKTIAMTTLQKAFITAVVAVVAGAGIYEARLASNLRKELQTLRAQSVTTERNQKTPSVRDDTAQQLAALREENERLNRNTSELLKLRDKVSRLQNEAEADSVADKNYEAEVQQALQSIPPVNTLVAVADSTISWNESIVTGGWKTPAGKRAIVLTTLERGDTTDQLTLRSKILEFSEEAGEKLGLAQFNLGQIKGSDAHKLTAEQSQAILKTIKDSPDVVVVSSPGVTTLSGRQAEIAVTESHTTSTGEPFTTGPKINFVPTISQDGQSVRMLTIAQLNYLVPKPFIKPR